MIFSKENFEESVNRLLSKPNNCGTDGILVSEFADYWKLNEEKILSLLREGKYKPSAVLLEEMIFKKGKKRLISKYTCTDRVIQDVLKILICKGWSIFCRKKFARKQREGLFTNICILGSLLTEEKKENPWVLCRGVP